MGKLYGKILLHGPAAATEFSILLPSGPSNPEQGQIILGSIRETP